MNYKNRSRALLAMGIVLVSSGTATAITSNWTGTVAGSGSWNNVNPTVPGWDSGTVPNAVGDIAQLTATLSGSPETIQDTGASVTLGAINYGGGNALGNFPWTITNTSGITLNQDGAGLGAATITNSSATAGNANALIISAGTMTLVDDLNITKTGGASTAANGAIQIASDITGNGNLTLNSNQVIPVLTNPTGAIRLTGNNSFVGNVLVQNGLTVFTNGSAFGNASNVITMGVSGSSTPGPEVTPYIISQAVVTVPNNIVVVPNNPTAVIGTTATAVAAGSYTGLISIGNGSTLYFHSNSGSNASPVASDVGLTISNVISGDGGIIKTGGSTTGGIVTLSDLNTFKGKTVISRGTLRVTSLNNYNGGSPTSASSSLGAPTTLANATIGMGGGNNNVGILGYVGNGETSDRPFEMAGSNGGGGVDSSGVSGPLILSGSVTSLAATKTFTLKGSNTGNNTINGNISNSAGTLSLVKSGGGKWILGGTNTHNGGTTISGGILQYQSAAAIAGSTRNVTVSTSGIAAAGYAINQGFVDRFVTTSAGTIALAANSNNNLDMTGFTAASLGAVGSVNFTGSLIPDAGVYRLGGGGGGILTTNTLLSGTNTLQISRNGGATSTVVLTGSNTFTGKTTIASGILSVSSLNRVVGGTATSNLGAPDSQANGTIDLGSGGLSGNLFYTGPGETTDRVINLSGTNGGLIKADGTGPLVFTSPFTATSNSKTLFLWGTSSHNNAINGTIPDGDSAAVISVTKEEAGKWILGGTNSYTGPTTINAGVLEISTTGSIDASSTINVNTAGSLLTNHVLASTLTVDGTATVRQNGGTAGASKVETLTIGAGGKLNLKDNDLVVGSVPNFDAVRTAIIAGKTNNAASGITSDMTGFGISRGFGYAMGNDPKVSSLLAGSLSGQAFDNDSVLVKFTLLGDADLDGDTDLNDLGLWSNGYTGDLGVTTSPTTFWTGGDFDYDGDTDLNDLGLWSSTYTGDFNGGPGSLVVNASNASPEAVAILNSMGFTVVPEPSTFVLAGVGLAAVGFAGLRRKRN